MGSGKSECCLTQTEGTEFCLPLPVKFLREKLAQKCCGIFLQITTEFSKVFRTIKLIFLMLDLFCFLFIHVL